jgi:Maltose acetyltransferase
MTEREKMLSGELYDPTDKELEQLRLNARKLARKYNSTDEDDQEEQAQILREFIASNRGTPIYRRLFILITDVIRSLEDSALLILTLHV